MSDLRDGFRDHKAHKAAKRRGESVVCWICGARVWNKDEKCSTCGTANDSYKDAKVMSWLPIESAPRGQEVLCYHPKWGNDRMSLTPVMRVGFVSDWHNRPPTHWMPLPEPPK